MKNDPHNKNGNTIRGILLDKNDLIDHCLPIDKAPDSIRNKTTPILNPLRIISAKNQLSEWYKSGFRTTILAVAPFIT